MRFGYYYKIKGMTGLFSLVMRVSYGNTELAQMVDLFGAITHVPHDLFDSMCTEYNP